MGKTLEELHELQSLPLNMKIQLTKDRIREWVREYGVDGTYISFSGGKDSTVLLYLARQMYPDIQAVFVDTGLEFPSIRKFVGQFTNVEWLKPKMNFVEVIEKYGYPFISKEVSETVYGAKKFLANMDSSGGMWKYRMEKLCGTGKYRTDRRKSTNSSATNYLEWGNTQTTRQGKSDTYQSGQTESTESFEDYENLKETIDSQRGSWRFKSLMGILGKDNSVIIPPPQVGEKTEIEMPKGAVRFAKLTGTLSKNNTMIIPPLLKMKKLRKSRKITFHSFLVRDISFS